MAAALLLTGAAHAEEARQPLEPPPSDAVINGVTVSVPKVVSRTRYGSVTREMSMSARVPFNDLDMNTPAGIAELDRRVSEAANYLCDQLDKLYPQGTPEEYQCVREAVGEARPQVIAARAP